MCEVGPYIHHYDRYTTQGYYNFSIDRLGNKLTKKTFLAHRIAEIKLPSQMFRFDHTALKCGGMMGGNDPLRWTFGHGPL